MTIAVTMKIELDPSIALAFLTCCAQPAARSQSGAGLPGRLRW